jgi:Fe-S cluster biogenesis protein NfuA
VGSMTANLRAKGDRIEVLLDELHEHAEPRSRQLADELLGLVTELYGAALSRIVELARQKYPALWEELVADELLKSLLLVHGLQPESLGARLERALERARPLLASHGGGVELLEVDPCAGAVRLRLLGSCDGCPASAVTLRSAVERAIAEEAPEIVVVDVEEAGGLAEASAQAGAGAREAASARVGAPVLVRTRAGREAKRGGGAPPYSDCPSELARL